MVKLIMLEETAERCRYSYQPEETGKPGIVEVEKSTGAAKLVELAECDGEHTLFYRSPMATAFKSFAEKGEYPKEYVRHWY